MMRDR